MLKFLRLLHAFWLMARPLMLVSAGMVYVLGNLIARAMGYAIESDTFLWGVATLLPTIVSIHYVNEYADFETDMLTSRTSFSGGSQVLPNGLVTRQAALTSAWIVLVLGIGIALLGAGMGKLNIMALLVLGIGAFGGWMYSLPPLALAWRGWGEVDNAILGGVVLPLYGYVVPTAGLNWQIVFFSLPFALLVFNNLLATTWPDREADRQVGKCTLATQLTASQLRRLYRAVAIMSLILVVVISINILPAGAWLSGLCIVPFVTWGFRRYTRQQSPLPSVVAMIALLVSQMAVWFWAAHL